MASFDDIRRAIPAAANFSDEEIMDRLSQAAGIPVHEVANELGYKDNRAGKNRERLSASVDNYQAGLYGVGEAVSGKLGLDRASQWAGQRRRSNEIEANVASGRAHDLGAVDSWGDVHGARDLGDYAVGLGIQSLPYLAEAAVGGVAARGAMSGTRAALTAAEKAGDVATAAKAGRALQVGSTAGAVGASYPSAVGDVLQNQREQSGGGGTDLGSAAALAVPYAALNALGLEGAAARATGIRAGVRALDEIGGLRGAAARAGVAGVKGAAEEAVGETGQEAMNQLGRMAVDPTETFLNDRSLERFKESAIGGGLLGGLGAAGAGGWRRSINDVSRETNLLRPDVQEEQGDPLRLGFNPLAGTPIVFPDGTVALSSEQELAACYPDLPATPSAPEPVVEPEVLRLGFNPLAGVPTIFPDGTVALNSEQELAARYPGAAPMPTISPDELRATAGEAFAKAFETVRGAGVPTKGTVASAVGRVIKGATSVEEVVDRLDEQIAATQKQRGQGAVARAELLTAWRDNLAPRAPQGEADVGVSDVPAAAPRDGGAAGGALGVGGVGVSGPGADATGRVPPAAGEPARGGPADAALGDAGGEPAAGVAPTVTVGRTGREKTVTKDQLRDMLAAAPQREQLRVRLALGQDLEGNQVRNPLTLEQIAQVEAELHGEAPQTRAAVAQTLAKYGVNEQVVDRATAGDMAAVPESDLLGMMVDGEPTGFRTSDNLAEVTGSDDIREDIGGRARHLAQQANDVLGNRRTAHAAERKDAAVEEALAALRAKPTEQTQATVAANEQALRDAGLDPEMAASDAALDDQPIGSDERQAQVDWNQNLDDGDTAFEDMPRSLQLQFAQLRRRAKAGEITPKEAREHHYDLQERANAQARPAGRPAARAAAAAVEQPAGRRGGRADGSDPDQRPVGQRGVGEDERGAAPAEAGQGGTADQRVRQDGEVTLTETERAGRAWDQVAGEVPGMPTWGELSAEDQETFTDFGEENWTRADVVLHAQRLSGSRPGYRIKRGDTTTVLYNGGRMQLHGAELSQLRRYPGVDAAMRTLERACLAHVVDGIDWAITGNDADFDGSVMPLKGGRAMVLRIGALNDAKRMEHVFLHEAAHLADQVLEAGNRDEGVYSRDPLLNVRVAGGKPRAMGAVMREVFAQREADPDSEFAKLLGYPLDFDVHGAVPATEVRAEVFAQLWALYLTRDGRAYLEDNLPLTATFLEDTHEDIVHTRGARGAAGAVQGEPRAEGSGGGGRQGGGPVEGQGGEGDRGRGDGSGVPADGVRRIARAEEGLKQLPGPVRPAAQRVFDTVANAAKKGLYAFAFTEDLADMAAKQLPSVREYMRLMAAKAAVKNDHELKLEEVLEKFSRLEGAEAGVAAGSVNRFIHDSTRSGMWGFKPTGAGTVDPELEARFKAFSPTAQEVVRAVFAHGQETLRRKQDAVRAEINAEFDQLLEDATGGERMKLERQRAAALRQYEALLSIRGDGPYAPLKRFGNYVVVARSQQYLDAERRGDVNETTRLQANEAHYFVQFAETMGEAKAMERQLGGQYTLAQAFEKDAARDYLMGGSQMFDAFRRLKQLVQDQLGSSKGDSAVGNINRMVSDLYLSSLAEASARKSEMKRRNIAGADLNMMRAFATQGRADAHFIGALLHNGDVTKAMSAMRKEAAARTPGRDERSRLLNEFMARHAASMDYREHPVQDKINRLTSLWMLVTSPAYYLSNALQTHMVSLPTMAGKHGYGRAAGVLNKAYGDLSPMLRGARASERMSFAAAPADVQGMLKELVDLGRIDIGLEQDLGKWAVTGDGKLSNGWNTVDRKLRGLTNKVETINRVATAIAAYRLERSAGRSHADAVSYAAKTVQTTHGDYSGFGSPRVLSNGAVPLAKVLFQFKKFQFIQASLIARLFTESFRGASLAEKFAARKSLAFILAHHAVMAGGLGLPAAQTIAYLVGAALGDDDEPNNPELALRQFVGDEDLANLLLKGVPAWAGVDLSGKIGMGQMVSALPFTAPDVTSRDGYKDVLLGLSGPFLGGLLPRFADGVGLIGKGDLYKGLEMLLPSGLANAMKGYRSATEGVTQRNGDVVMSPEDVGLAAAALQALGLPSTTLVQRQFSASAKFEYDQHFQARSSAVKQAYAKAYREGDAEALAEARQEWTDLQEVRERVGYTRQPLAQLLKAPGEQAKREASTAGGVQFNRNNRGFVEAMAGD